MYFHTSDTSGFMKKQLKFLKANEDFMKEFPSLNNLWQNWKPVLKLLKAIIKSYSATTHPF